MEWNKDQLHTICLKFPGVIHNYQVDWQADRYFIGGKMFALIGGEGRGNPIISLKCDPDRAEVLREEYEGIVPGYHMNKTHWNSIYFNAGVPDQMMEQLIRHAYELVFSKLTKKLQREIIETNE